MPEFVLLLPTRLIWYLVPTGVTKFVKEYFPSEVLTESAMVFCVGGVAELSSRTISKDVGSEETEVHSIVLVPEKSSLSLRAGSVICRASGGCQLRPKSH